MPTLSAEEKRRPIETVRIPVAQVMLFSQELLRFLDLAEYRRKNRIAPERWWWYLDLVR